MISANLRPPYLNNDMLVNVGLDSSLFPYSFDNLPNFSAPVDLHGKARPKTKNRECNEIPLNNAAISPHHLNSNNIRHATPTVYVSNSPTLPLSQRQTSAEGTSASQWGAYPAVHSYPNPGVNQNSRVPQNLPNSNNSSVRGAASKSRNSSGRSDTSNLSNKFPTKNTSAAAVPFGDLVSIQGDSMGSNRPGYPSTDGTLASSLQGPHDFVPPEVIIPHINMSNKNC